MTVLHSSSSDSTDDKNINNDNHNRILNNKAQKFVGGDWSPARGTSRHWTWHSSVQAKCSITSSIHLSSRFFLVRLRVSGGRWILGLLVNTSAGRRM